MKKYTDFKKKYLGFGERYFFTLVGFKEEEIESEVVHTAYEELYAFIVDENEVEIGKDWTLEAEFNTYMRVYDDEKLTHECWAKKILVYCSGAMWIIHLIN
jgi:hypothetical protein